MSGPDELLIPWGEVSARTNVWVKSGNRRRIYHLVGGISLPSPSTHGYLVHLPGRSSGFSQYTIDDCPLSHLIQISRKYARMLFMVTNKAELFAKHLVHLRLHRWRWVTICLTKSPIEFKMKFRSIPQPLYLTYHNPPQILFRVFRGRANFIAWVGATISAADIEI